MRILCVEDDQHLADAVVMGLQEEGYMVDHAARVAMPASWQTPGITT
jgi:DNA-binding response OmpR family regulator